MRTHWKINTSNPGKLEEFKRLFSAYGCTLEATHVDLREIDADPITVVAHKASQMDDDILIEDTSLAIDGASIGVHIRWLLDHLNEYIGHAAKWSVLLAFRKREQIYIYKGSISGNIVSPRGSAGFGFDPVFLPDGAKHTLAEAKPDTYNARSIAVEQLIKNNTWSTHALIDHWNGPWQDYSNTS